MDELEHDYNVLNLQPGASLEEVKQAYRTLALQWHPDRYPQDDSSQIKAAQKFKEINQAYNRLRLVLGQPQSSSPQVRAEPTSSPSPRSRSTRPYSSQRQPFTPQASTSAKPPSLIYFLPWGWLLGIFLGYALLGGILDTLYPSLPNWGWAGIWITWFVLALIIASSAESPRHSWLLVLMFAGGGAGWIAGDSWGIAVSVTWALVGIALGALASSDASPWTFIW
ncbi:MAG: J domain-containing protein [Oscillatoriales cyanobacterium SM2_3_0]|nr:J domain-containing protein [Oscillatoriales cyanobacterium SM2_3_0]